ncbi:HEAT repeat domain-containing protein [Micromonospora sp. NPDC048930]|uniref:HEAT repeat domain-containing protein n=1 Tax=Micromonospora sp. NPDC048930 TaxID=3364261 RepID=UPI0037190D04
MLNGIDDIDWSRLSHAYGPADDVPDQIRALASADPETRARARYELYGNIFHQGSRYEASAYAVPFLLELLADPTTPEPTELLALLVSIAIGYDENWLPDGLPVAEWRRAAAGGEALLAAAPRPGDDDFDEDEGDYAYLESLSEDDQHRLDAHVALVAWEAVRAGVPLLRDLLTRPEPPLRACAAYALAWFPEDAAGTLPVLAALRHDEYPPIAATALVTAGLLGEAPDAGLLADPRPEVRWGAAVGRARVLGRDADEGTVQELLAWAGRRSGRATGVPFLDGDLAGLAALALRQLGPDRAGQGFEALLRRIPTASGEEALPVVAEALRLAFPEGPLPAGTPAAALTEPQRRLAATLAGSPDTWLINGRSFGNLRMLVHGYGLPDEAGQLRTYLDGAPAVAER